MADQAALAGIPTAAEVDADLRSRGADYTPRMVARACVEALSGQLLVEAVDRDRSNPLRVLDVCAGAGVYSSELARHWVRVLGLPREWLHITAVEIHEPELEHLERWADDVVIGDVDEALATVCDHCEGGVIADGEPCPECDGEGSVPVEYDLALGNPNFELLRAPSIERGRYDVEASLPARLLTVAAAVALLHRHNAWSKDGPGTSVRRCYPPAFAWDIPGAVRFRAPGARNPETGKLYGSDQHSYTWSLWRRGYQGPTVTYLLPQIEPLRWSTRPGTETGVEARELGLVEVPR